MTSWFINIFGYIADQNTQTSQYNYLDKNKTYFLFKAWYYSLSIYLNISAVSFVILNSFECRSRCFIMSRIIKDNLIRKCYHLFVKTLLGCMPNCLVVLCCFSCYIPSQRPIQSNKVLLIRDGFLTTNIHAMLWCRHLVRDFAMPPCRMSWTSVSSRKCGWLWWYRWFHYGFIRPGKWVNLGYLFVK